jgi:protein-S-isoprenylcysteine O-methyltransferase Ste14
VRRTRFGDRGEYYVVAQFVLMIALAIGPAQVQDWPGLIPRGGVVDIVALALVLVGVALLLAGGRRLGSNLTPLPYPKAGGTFVESGVYRHVRHPIYGGIILVAAGWSLRRGGGLVALYAVCLVVLLVIKSRREEVWLTVKHSAYAAYRRRTRRFLPFLW